jgi:hypothetical protein
MKLALAGLVTMALAAPARADDAARAPVRAMRGPFAGLDDYCDALDAQGEVETDIGPQQLRCEGRDGDGLRHPGFPVAAAPPYREIALLAVSGLDDYWQLAFRTGDGWWIDGRGIYAGSSRAKADIAVTVDGGALVRRAGGRAPLVAVRFHVDTYVDRRWFVADDTSASRWWSADLALCGVGAHQPVCLDDFPLRGRVEDFQVVDDEHRRRTRRATFAWSWRLDGDAVVITGDAARAAAAMPGDPDRLARLLGRHPL